MRIEFDFRKAQANIRKHGVSFEEAETCLFDPDALVREDPDAQGEARFVLVGLSERGRLLTVVYALPDEDAIRLISARPSTAKEIKSYA
ncbi:MAG TPA: BrnT family toxin [Methylococcaceae bacterium]|nr:BrnT family toxin [Methylococcaceae bacterium]